MNEGTETRGAQLIRAGRDRNADAHRTHRDRVIDALTRASGGVRLVTTEEVQAATRRKGAPLGLSTVRKHLTEAEAEGSVVSERSSGHKRTWRPSAVVRRVG